MCNGVVSWHTPLLQHEWVKVRWWGKNFKKNIVKNVPTQAFSPDCCSNLHTNHHAHRQTFEPIVQESTQKNTTTLHFFPIDTPAPLDSCNIVYLLAWTIQTRKTKITLPPLPLFFLTTNLTPRQIFLATFFSHLRYNHHHMNDHNTQQFTNNTPTQH